VLSVAVLLGRLRVLGNAMFFLRPPTAPWRDCWEKANLVLRFGISWWAGTGTVAKAFPAARKTPEKSNVQQLKKSFHLDRNCLPCTTILATDFGVAQRFQRYGKCSRITEGFSR
jgi:hypothetical protein